MAWENWIIIFIQSSRIGYTEMDESLIAKSEKFFIGDEFQW